MGVVTMMCLTTKQKFEAEDPEVVVLANGRFAYRAECPWLGKGSKTLTAYKFCSRLDHEAFEARQSTSPAPETPPPNSPAGEEESVAVD